MHRRPDALTKGGAAPLAEVKARLREVFEAFPINTLEAEGTVLVEPRLRESAIAQWREGYLAVAGGESLRCAVAARV